MIILVIIVINIRKKERGAERGFSLFLLWVMWSSWGRCCKTLFAPSQRHQSIVHSMNKFKILQEIVRSAKVHAELQVLQLTVRTGQNILNWSLKIQPDVPSTERLSISSIFRLNFKSEIKSYRPQLQLSAESAECQALDVLQNLSNLDAGSAALSNVPLCEDLAGLPTILSWWL